MCVCVCVRVCADVERDMRNKQVRLEKREAQLHKDRADLQQQAQNQLQRLTAAEDACKARLAELKAEHKAQLVQRENQFNEDLIARGASVTLREEAADAREAQVAQIKVCAVACTRIVFAHSRAQSSYAAAR